MGPSSRAQYLSATQSFCNSFAQNKDLDTIMEHFSVTHQISIIEHGEKALAPFLGKEYDGIAAVRSYFETISSLLSYKDLEFVEFIVDAEGQKVAVTGRGKFTWKETNEEWEEALIWVLDFDDEKLITDWQIWADSGSAYLARIGQLNEVKQKTSGKDNA